MRIDAYALLTLTMSTTVGSKRFDFSLLKFDYVERASAVGDGYY